MAFLAALALVAAGCETQQPRPAPQSSVLDVSPRYPTYAQPYPAPTYAPPVSQAAYVPPGPAYLPPGASPSASDSVVVEPPVVTKTPPAAKAKAKPAAKGSYVVQHGDTLFHIAQVHYGEGKKWKQIVAANPGVTPATLKVGQKLVLP
jgi:nucleoid-associated protein YgaU